MNLKSYFKSIIRSTFLYPIYIEHCSQSIYKPLLGCLLLWDVTNNAVWEKRSKKLCHLLIKIQKSDGGFDNGYDYNFGRFHKKGEPIAPELVGLFALTEYYKRFGGENVAYAAKKAAYWIKNNAFQINGNEWAIPYGPYSSKEVIVYNGTSFAAGSLGVYLSVFPSKELEIIYHGMNKYLYNVLSSTPNELGKFWYYSDQSRKDLSDYQRNKIDYYHQMQQVEIHSEAENCLSSPFQKEIIYSATEFITAKQLENGAIPYTKQTENKGGDLHLWGFCSCASGFILAGKLNQSKKIEYLERAKKIYNWIIKYSWNGEYFYPIISENGKVTDKRFYVRSDAWVFHSFSVAVKEGIEAERYLDICEKSYCKMEAANFSGIENHASNKRIRLVNNILQKVLFIKNWLWQK
jgi:hypothetical protein